jgi:hypothetical protein
VQLFEEIHDRWGLVAVLLELRERGHTREEMRDEKLCGYIEGCDVRNATRCCKHCETLHLTARRTRVRRELHYYLCPICRACV